MTDREVGGDGRPTALPLLRLEFIFPDGANASHKWRNTNLNVCLYWPDFFRPTTSGSVLWKTPLIVDYCTGPLPDGPSWRTPTYSSCATPLENSPFQYRGKNEWKSIFVCVYNVEDNFLNDIQSGFQLSFVQTKTIAITLANHKRHKQSCEPIKTQRNHMQLRWSWKARENVCNESRLVLVFLTIGWKSGAHFFNPVM